MGLGSFLFGKSGGMERAPLLTEGQQRLQSNLTGGLEQPTSSGLDLIQMLLSQDPQAMRQFEAPLMRQFEQQTVPSIAERFAGMGSHGAQSSSAQNLALAQSGKELQESLGALRGQLGMQALSQLQGMLSQSQRPTFENIYKQPTSGLFGGIASGAGQGLGMLAGSSLMGGASGGSLGGNFGNAPGQINMFGNGRI